jgi:hypothetical protein
MKAEIIVEWLFFLVPLFFFVCLDIGRMKRRPKTKDVEVWPAALRALEVPDTFRPTITS